MAGSNFTAFSALCNFLRAKFHARRGIRGDDDGNGFRVNGKTTRGKQPERPITPAKRRMEFNALLNDHSS